MRFMVPVVLLLAACSLTREEALDRLDLAEMAAQEAKLAAESKGASDAAVATLQAQIDALRAEKARVAAEPEGSDIPYSWEDLILMALTGGATYFGVNAKRNAARAKRGEQV